jgi:hypothetical protein
VTHKHLDDSELDALVLRELSCLPGLAPSRGFEDRVMARVILPRPAAVVLLQRAGAWIRQPRRAVALATAYAACVVVSVALAAPWVAAHSGVIGVAAAWAAARAGAWLDAATLAVATWAVRSGIADAVRSAAGTGPRLWAEVATLTLAYAGGGFGLHVLLKAPRRSDASVARSL